MKGDALHKFVSKDQRFGLRHSAGTTTALQQHTVTANASAKTQNRNLQPYGTTARSINSRKHGSALCDKAAVYSSMSRSQDKTTVKIGAAK